MDGIARGSPDDRGALFREAAARLGVEPTIVEKDFWVCWTLKRIYTIPGLPRMLFKGGTSLSKCFRIIRRFSEDIDIGIERSDIGLGGDEVPAQGMGSTRLKKARKRLSLRAHEYVKDEFMERIGSGCREALGADCQLVLLEDAQEPTVMFEYPRSLDGGEYGENRYIAPAVRLELGARSDHDPVERVEIVPYAAEEFPSWFAEPGCTVVAQAPQRTLLEKALILHTARAKSSVSKRSSRHAYDLVMLHRSGVVGHVTPELFRQVAIHKKVFGEDSHAGRAVETGICMVPTASMRGELERDYRDMREMFFGDSLSFDEILLGLQELEGSINARR